MSDFITLEDYDSTLHREILDALVRSDETIVEVCEDQAIAEMKGYLSSRYDVDTIFAKTGDERNSLILMMAKDIAVYHIFCVHNPYKISDIRKSRYDRAIEWLKQVANQEINVEGADELPDTDQATNSRWQIKSNPLHPTHF